jgi:hypothetical protein
MRFIYQIYPQAQERLESKGLLKRIKEAHDSEDGLPFIGHTMDSEVVGAIKEMQEDKYFTTLPSDERKQFMGRLNEAFKDKEGHRWKVHRNGEILEEPAEAEDFYLMGGWLSSCVLGKDEIWNYQKFGFKSLSDFVGCMGAAVWQSNKSGLRKGYEGTTTTPNGRVLTNNLSGDHNLDLRIFQTDITPDRTIDPTGAEVSYRPELRDDGSCVAAYHSTEPDFLVGVLKWIHQQDIPTEMLKNNGLPLITWARSLGHRIGAATECFGDFGGIDGPMIKLGSFYDPIPILDENLSTDQPTFDGVGVSGEGYFGMYVGPNKELMFSYQGRGERQPQKKIELSFLPSEADHLLRGICYQAANGLGRTVPQKLISLVEYRFSEQMDGDIENIRRR